MATIWDIQHGNGCLNNPFFLFNIGGFIILLAALIWKQFRKGKKLKNAKETD
jgi:hypothetical protein